MRKFVWENEYIYTYAELEEMYSDCKTDAEFRAAVVGDYLPETMEDFIRSFDGLKEILTNDTPEQARANAVMLCCCYYSFDDGDYCDEYLTAREQGKSSAIMIELL